MLKYNFLQLYKLGARSSMANALLHEILDLIQLIVSCQKSQGPEKINRFLS